jgi:hypothetical protein
MDSAYAVRKPLPAKLAVNVPRSLSCRCGGIIQGVIFRGDLLKPCFD